jgi:predicted lipoprotein with Yx(FWY)xxD motif
MTIKAMTTSLGTVLVNNAGHTLYLLTSDGPTNSTCTALLCATIWPSVKAAGGGVAGPGVQQSLLGTVHRPDGSVQITYGGHPLYTYVGDLLAAQISGEGISSFGGVWYVLDAATGAAIK